MEIFQQIKHFPDPAPGDDGHYLPFASIYGTETDEEHRPSKKLRPQKQGILPFHGKLQHVRNADLMLECEECGMWRLIYTKRKLSSSVTAQALTRKVSGCRGALE